MAVDNPGFRRPQTGPGVDGRELSGYVPAIAKLQFDAIARRLCLDAGKAVRLGKVGCDDPLAAFAMAYLAAVTVVIQQFTAPNATMGFQGPVGIIDSSV